MSKQLLLLFICFTFAINGTIQVDANKGELWMVNSTQMYTYNELEQDINQLVAQFGSDLVTVRSEGRTFDEREIYHIIVGNLNAEKHILLIGAIHGREYITAQLVMKQLIDLCNLVTRKSSYNEVSYEDLLRDTAVHFIPMSNPDGVTISQLGLEGVQHRATRQMIYQIYTNDGAIELNNYLQQWKANARGVDLNRNFDALWDEYQNGSQKPSSSSYKGQSPHSEIESKILVDVTEQYAFVETISYHTQGQVIYWYFGQDGLCLEKSSMLADLASQVTGYETSNNYLALDPAGYKDWAIEKKNIPSLTIEIGTGKNPVNPSQFSKIWEENKNLVPELLLQLTN